MKKTPFLPEDGVARGRSSGNQLLQLNLKPIIRGLSDRKGSYLE